jgi:hypothetical protein
MRLSKSTLLAAGAAAILFADSAAAAAPLSDAAQAATSAVVAANYHTYNNPDAYRTGSSRWWEEMDRQDRGGRG